jgi:uncharacterized membrane protein HdeD (DUF308 family)
VIQHRGLECSAVRNLMRVPHPLAQIVMGVVFIVVGLLAPMVSTKPAGHRATVDPISEFAPPMVILTITVVIGSFLIIQSLTVLALRRK